LTLIPDVVLLDIALPGIDGWEVLRRLRADPRGQHIPVLVITAHDTAESQTKPTAAEADGVFGKPFQLSHLRARIAALATSGRDLAA
jgi:CheY-like chemotaxis protein